MTLDSQITEDEKKVITEILLDENSYHKSLFIQLMNPIVHCLFNMFQGDKRFIIDTYFEQALVTAMLRVKIVLEINSETMRFSTKDLAKSILHDYDSPEKEAALQKVTDSIKKYNKHQCRSFFQHARKNDACFFASDINEKKGFDLGKYLAHERYLCEIEYLLKKESSAIGGKVQEAVNEYALKRIRCIPAWESLDLEQLNILRKTYSKLRPFFLGGAGTSQKIPSYCYGNYLECFRLIYEYVTFYTPADLLDLAYFSLDNSYTLESYISVNSVIRMPVLNDFSIFPSLRPYYDVLFRECVQALKKIYSYMSERQSDNCKPAADIYIHEFAEYLREHVVSLHRCNKRMAFYGWIYDTKKLPLDGLVLYNTFWKGYILVSQREFMDKYKAVAKDKVKDEDKDKEILMRLRLTFESIGIDFNVNDNEEIYRKITQQILSAEDIKEKTLIITHLLKVIYQREASENQPCLSEPFSFTSTEAEASLNLNEQKSILERLNRELPQYIKIASGRSDNNMWERGMAENLTYQFFYRNYFGLDKANILFESPVGLQNTVTEFLKRYGLNLTNKLDIENCPWLKYAMDNLKEEPAAKVYKKFMNYSKSYVVEPHRQRWF